MGVTRKYQEQIKQLRSVNQDLRVENAGLRQLLLEQTNRAEALERELELEGEQLDDLRDEYFTHDPDDPR